MSKGGWTFRAIIWSDQSRKQFGQMAAVPMSRHAGLLYPFAKYQAAKSITLLSCLLAATMALGQYSGNVQGTIFDPAKQVVADAIVLLTNTETGVTSSTKSNSSGLYRFSNVAPGKYKVTVEASGFKRTELSAVLTTEATLGLDINLQIGSVAESVTVIATEEKSLNPDETRLETSLGARTISSLPKQNNSVYSMVTAAPGVTGYIDTRNTDNFTNEHLLDVSANGQYYGGNAYVLDGISIVSNIVTGMVNISPNPDSIQEASLQTNTFNARYANSSSVVDELTSKSGTNQFHGSVNFLHTDQSMTANSEFIHSYSPFHRHDLTAAFGGPVVKDKTFFFSSVELKRSSSQGLTTTQGSFGSTGLVTYEDPAFAEWASANFPATHGTYILNKYKPTSVATRGIVQWADPNYSTFCSSPIPGCNTPFLDQGTPTTTPFSNGLQYNFRGDQYFHGGKDRVFGNFYRTNLDYQVADIRPEFTVVNHTLNWFLSTNYTHVFSPNFTNVLAFGTFRAGGNTNANDLNGLAGDPLSKMPFLHTNAEGIDIGGAAWGPAVFIQHNYDWNDLVTYIRGNHKLTAGVDVYHGDDSADFSAPRERPSYQFTDLTAFVQDQVFQESGVTFNPITGQFSPNLFGDQNTRIGAFFQDDWKIRPNFLLTAGLRWDDFGNPSNYKYDKVYPEIDNIHIPSTGSIDSRFTNAVIRGSKHLFNHGQKNNWSPRVGFAWSPIPSRSWSIRGGAGLYRTPITLGQALDSLDLNPPNWIFPVFGVQQAIPAIYSFGTQTTHPYGFVYPQIPTTGLNSSGGLIGVASAVNGVDPDLSIQKIFVYQFGTEQQLPKNIVVGLNYSGSHGYDILSGNTDYNRFPGDLVDGKLDRLNPNFGSMGFVWNTGKSNYNAMVATVRESLSRITWQASFTWAHSLDNGVCATRFDYNSNLDCSPDQRIMQYGTSSFDVQRRFSLSGVYRFPEVKRSHLSILLGGWQISTIAIAQSGTPFTALNTSNYCQPPSGTPWGPANPYPNNCGDYNQDGFNLDYPNLGSTPRNGWSRTQYLNGVFGSGVFTAPTLGMQGNERRNLFRNAGLFQVDANLGKSFSLPWFRDEHSTLQLRGEFYNLLNRVNLTAVDNSLTSATFGRSRDTLQPRTIQVVARFEF